MGQPAAPAKAGSLPAPQQRGHGCARAREAWALAGRTRQGRSESVTSLCLYHGSLQRWCRPFHGEVPPCTAGCGHCAGQPHGMLQGDTSVSCPCFEIWASRSCSGRRGTGRSVQGLREESCLCTSLSECLFIYHVTVVTAGKSRRGIAARQCS